MRHVYRHARSTRGVAGWGSSVAALGAALLVVGLTSPASSADAAPGDSAALEQSTSVTEGQAAADADATSTPDQSAAAEQQGDGDLPATAADEGAPAPTPGEPGEVEESAGSADTIAEQSSSEDGAAGETAAEESTATPTQASAEAVDAADEPVLSTLSVEVTDEAGAAVPGVGFELWLESNERTGLQQSADTDADFGCSTAGDGTCTVGEDGSGAAQLEVGTYYWVQTETPEGYQAPEDGDEPAGTATITEDEAGIDLDPTEVTLTAVEDQEAADDDVAEEDAAIEGAGSEDAASEDEAADEAGSESAAADDETATEQSDRPATDESDHPAALSSEDGAMAPMSVPNPSSNAGTAIINVNVGGLRTGTGSNAVSGLEGVTLRLHTGNSNGPSNPVNEDWAECVSDSDGDCSFTVPETQPEQGHWDCFFIFCDWIVTQPEGDNYDARFWVVQESAPAGWYANDDLVVGESSHSSSDYQFRTGSQLRAGQTYRSGNHFMASGSWQTSSGTWQNSIANPQLPQTCADGLNVALVLDLSGSMDDYLGNLKNSAKGFVDALAGTNSSVALFTFAENAPRTSGSSGQNYPLMAIDAGSNQQTINNRIDAYSSGGGTNWDSGLYQVAQSGTHFDLTVVVTDGNATFYRNGNSTSGSGRDTRFIETEYAIFSANAIKAEGTRVLAVGVGDGISGSAANLSAISGPTPYTSGTAAKSADYFQSSWQQLATLLSEIAKGATCQATIDVTKYTQTYGSTTWEETPGWAFDAAQQTGTSTFASIGDGTTGTDGTVEFTVQFDTMNATTTLRLTEMPSAAQRDLGWELVADRVQCTVNGSAVAVDVNASGLSLTLAGIGVNDHVSCDFYNRQVLTPGLEVVKHGWDAEHNEIASGSAVVSGTVVTWTYEVTNTGETTLHDLTVVDDQVGSATCPATSLPPGESMTCTASGPVTALP